MKFRLHTVLIVCSISFLLFLSNAGRTASQEGQASIYFSPSQGTFEVGNTFAVSIFVNTGGQDINAVRLDLSFPSDKLQVVNPTAGNSFITLWIAQPEFSNTEGTLYFEGGLPSPGINTSAGLITTVVFRTKAPGEAVISAQNTSRVLANDGKGTDLLTSFGQGRYILSIPAPEGPIITSSSHGDQNKWYQNNNPIFIWELESLFSPIEYSWSFNEDPQDIPDNEADGQQTTTAYKDIQSGIWYFHVKAEVAGVWGETSHYSVRIDTDSPAAFEPTIAPKSAEPDIRRFISFVTTDQHSGIDHYEVKIESLTDSNLSNPFFIEVSSPWQAPSLSLGKYKITVRAYDKAVNYYDGEVIFEIRPDLSSILTNHGLLFGSFMLPWWIVIVLIIIFLIISLFLIILIICRRKRADSSDQLSNYLERLKGRMKRKRTTLKRELKEENEIQKILKKESKKKHQRKSSTRKKKVMKRKKRKRKSKK